MYVRHVTTIEGYLSVIIWKPIKFFKVPRTGKYFTKLSGRDRSPSCNIQLNKSYTILQLFHI